MKKRLNKKLAYRLSLSLVLAIAVLGVVYLNFDRFFKKSAEILIPSLQTQTSVSYLDGSGVRRDGLANSPKLYKLALTRITADIKGRSDETKEVKIDYLDDESNKNLGSITTSLDQTGVVTPNWTNFPEVDPTTPVDIRISTAGFLARRVVGVLLGDGQSLNAGQLRPGDLDQSGKIDYKDYIAWKAKYGQKLAGDAADFNGDGKIDMYDFAVSFGSRCYNATENNQDSWCQQ
jgi:hypothetical protein